ncbi:hypothetical protein CVS40_2308 [Lucilia cuprina]|nr:hypothetical protein CVS40_2308 [Lucilia cuprina]
MQFNKVLLVFVFVFIGCCCESALTARLHHQGRSASLRIFPLRQRKLSTHGRSTTSGSLYEVPATAPAQAEEGRGLMKKFMLFKSLFLQEKSEPNNNIIIITQPATNTPTTPTTTGTTDTTAATTAAALPTGFNTGRDSKTEDENDDDLPIKIPQLEGAIKELDNSQADEIVQELIKQTKSKRKRLNKLTKFNKRNNLQNQKSQKRRIRLSKRNQQRRRLSPQQLPQQQQQKQNTINRENLLTNMNLTKRPNQHAKNNSNKNHNNNSNMEESSNDNNTNNNNNNTSGILNLNTNIRLQNIMNAFRKQTPIMYNY